MLFVKKIDLVKPCFLHRSDGYSLIVKKDWNLGWICVSHAVGMMVQALGPYVYQQTLVRQD